MNPPPIPLVISLLVLPPPPPPVGSLFARVLSTYLPPSTLLPSSSSLSVTCLPATYPPTLVQPQFGVVSFPFNRRHRHLRAHQGFPDCLPVKAAIYMLTGPNRSRVMHTLKETAGGAARVLLPSASRSVEVDF